MKKTKPTISIIMAAYNAERFIKRSLQSCLDQTFTNWELLIVNDASTDKTRELIKSFDDDRIKYLENDTQMGQAESRNRALRAAQGQYLAILDADDISAPTRLQKQVDLMLAQPTTVIIGSWAHVINDQGIKIGNWRFPQLPALLMAQMYLQFPIVHSSALLRASVIKEEKVVYNPSMVPCEDYDLFFILSHRGEIRVIPEFLVDYRLHNQSSTQIKKSNISRSLVAILSRELDKLQLHFSTKEISNLTSFLHPTLGTNYQLWPALLLVVRLRQGLRRKLKLRPLQLFLWDVYVLKTVGYHWLMQLGLR